MKDELTIKTCIQKVVYDRPTRRCLKILRHTGRIYPVCVGSDIQAQRFGLQNTAQFFFHTVYILGSYDKRLVHVYGIP